MIRTLIFFLKLAVLVAAAVWLAARPGRVNLEWLGYRLDTSIGVAVAAMVALVVLAAILYHLWRLLVRSPRQIARSRQDSRRRRGYQALTRGFVAVAAGDAAAAKRLARRANELLDEPPLTLLLGAQAAQLGGDEAAARRQFTAMLERPDASFLGVRGLLMQAMREGNDTEAAGLAARAHRERPNAAWAVKALLDLRLKTGDWVGAEATLKDAVRLKAIDAATGRHLRAVILAERASGPASAEERLRHAEAAARLVPDFLPARIAEARALAYAGRERAAGKAVEQAWAAMPHPELAGIYAGLAAGASAIERLRRLERLRARNAGARETHLALAAAALDAGVWGEARRHLDDALADPSQPVTVGLARLMARLEESERGDGAMARRWLVTASEAAPDPAWVCGACGAPGPRWQARCPACGAFDSLSWRQPRRQEPALAPLAPALAPPAAAAHAVAPAMPARPAAESEAKADTGGGAPVDAARLVN